MPAPTLLNTPQGCDLCLFLPFLFHCSFTTNLHVPSILKMLLSSLLLFLLSWVIIIPPENIWTPFLTLDLWFICYFPMKSYLPLYCIPWPPPCWHPRVLTTMYYHYHLVSIHMHWIQAVWMDPELMLWEFQFMCLIGQTHLFYEKTWHEFFPQNFHQNNIKVQYLAPLAYIVTSFKESTNFDNSSVNWFTQYN